MMLHLCSEEEQEETRKQEETRRAKKSKTREKKFQKIRTLEKFYHIRRLTEYKIKRIADKLSSNRL